MFVLGAGVSYHARFPLAWELLTQVYERLSAEERKQLVEAIRYFYPYEASARKPDALVKQVKVEEFMSLLDMSNWFNERLPSTFFRPPAIQALQVRLLQEISALMLQRQRAAEEENRVGYMDAFVAKLRRTDTVVTFNWDVLLDRCLRHANWRPAFHPGQGSGPRDILVLKLHGSIDWYHGQDLEMTSHPDVSRVQSQLYQVSYAALLDGTAPVRAGAAPFVVPPTFFKDVRGTNDLEDIWKTAFERLQQADEIHFCGYRLPPEDMYARFVLRRAIRHNGLLRRRRGHPELKITVVNPDPAVKKFLKANVYPKVSGSNDKFQESRWAKP